MAVRTIDSAPLETGFTGEPMPSQEEEKVEIEENELDARATTEEVETEEQQHRYKDKSRSNDSRSTALTAESPETATAAGTERDRSVARLSNAEAKLELIVEPAQGIVEEESLSDNVGGSVIEIETDITLEDNIKNDDEPANCIVDLDNVTEKLHRSRSVKGEPGDFFEEIVAFAESQNALEFSWVAEGDAEVVTEENSEEFEEPFSEAKAASADESDDESGDELMGRYNAADEYLGPHSKSRSPRSESRSLIGIPEVVEFDRDYDVQSVACTHDDGMAHEMCKSTKKKNDSDVELPFDEACQDKTTKKTKTEVLEALPEIKRVYDIDEGDIDSLIQIVVSYKERLQLLLAEREELLKKDIADYQAASFDKASGLDINNLDAIDRTRKLLEELKVATLSRKNNISLKKMEPPGGKIKNRELREREVFAAVHQVDWCMFRVRKAFEKIQAESENNERGIPEQFKGARIILERSQAHLSRLRECVATALNPISSKA